MDQKTSAILPPPSVDDLLSLGSEARVGQVDFAHRLVSVPDVPEPTPRPRVVAAVPEPVEEPVVEAMVEPVVEEAPAQPAPRTRAKAAPRAAKPAAARTPAARKPAARKSSAAQQPQPTQSVEHALRPSVARAIMPIANLSGDADADASPTLRMPLDPAEPPRPTPGTDHRGEDSHHLGATVQAVADAAIERLLEAENATLRHLAALEAEAARRAELLTAQAELDAELIRITARREAHAIISEARSQAGLSPSSTREGRQLAEISDAVSRFAESIESSLTPVRRSSDEGDLT